MGTLTQDDEFIKGAQQNIFILVVSFIYITLDCVFALPLRYAAPVDRHFIFFIFKVKVTIIKLKV